MNLVNLISCNYMLVLKHTIIHLNLHSQKLVLACLAYLYLYTYQNKFQLISYIIN